MNEDQIYDLLIKRTEELAKAVVEAKVPYPIDTTGIKCQTPAMKYLCVIFRWQCGLLCTVRIWITTEECPYRCFNDNPDYLDIEYAQECTDGVKFSSPVEVAEWLKRKGAQKKYNQI